MSIEIPSQGFIFWPVGTGDSTTAVIAKNVFMQVDLHHLAAANGDGDPHVAIVDRLIEILPKVNGRPYLSLFVLTHPDKDHCLGFIDLLKRVTIGELWFSPRVFREYPRDLCDDATAFRKEARRRRDITIANVNNSQRTNSGDRIRIIGYDTLLEESNYQGFPRSMFTVPGNTCTSVDGKDYGDSFRAFIHAPFKEHAEGERNDTSIAMQIVLNNGSATGKALLLGDHCYPTVKRIFEISKAADVAWDVLLAPHHCSKSLMYWRDQGMDEAELKQELLDKIEEAGGDIGYIIASCEKIPDTNKKGDNPPHAKAKIQYELIAPSGFMCTQDYPDELLIFTLTDKGLVWSSKSSTPSKSLTNLSKAATLARGTNAPPTTRVGFGTINGEYL